MLFQGLVILMVYPGTGVASALIHMLKEAMPFVFSLVYPTFPIVCTPHVRFGSCDHFALTTIPSSSTSSCLCPPIKSFNIDNVSLLHHLILSFLFKCDFIGLSKCDQACTCTCPLPCPIPPFTTTNLCRTAIKRYKGQFLVLLTQY